MNGVDVFSYMRHGLLSIGILFSLLVQAQDWEELSTSPFPQRHHGIGFSSGGYGYVVTGSSTNDVWKYTPESDSWEQMEDYSNIMRGYGIGDMDGDVGYFGFGYTFGGPLTGAANDLWKFDGQTETFDQLADCPCTPRAHPAFVTFEDKIYMGLGSSNGNLGDWWEYDVPTNSWTEKASFIGANRHHPYQFVIGEYIYVGSGHHSDWYRYDPSVDQWTQIADHPSYIRVAGAQFAYEGKGYTLSGVADFNGSDHEAMPTGEFWEYDPMDDTWTELPPHPGLSRWAPAYFIIDGWVYLIAGETYDGETATYRYQLGDSPSAVGENERTEELELYPMPFDNSINLPKNKNWKSARILSVTGAEALIPSLENGLINTRDLEVGVYILEIFDGSKYFRQNVIKK